MANNDEYNDDNLCRDFFVGFNFWSRLSFQISEFQVHCLHPVAILNSTARTTRWTGTASEKNAQFLRAKFEK